MPALSFQEEWLDKLLSNTKQQTTRQQTDRIKVGDVCSIYNQQRRRITDKPLRKTTEGGYEFILRMIEDEGQYPRPVCDKRGGYSLESYYAHFLGKVVITAVEEMLPLRNSARSTWAMADGFDNFTCADTWFTKRHGEEWVDRWWTVIRWDGWLERYFEPADSLK